MFASGFPVILQAILITPLAERMCRVWSTLLYFSRYHALIPVRNELMDLFTWVSCLSLHPSHLLPFLLPGSTSLQPSPTSHCLHLPHFILHLVQTDSSNFSSYLFPTSFYLNSQPATLHPPSSQVISICPLHPPSSVYSYSLSHPSLSLVCLLSPEAQSQLKTANIPLPPCILLDLLSSFSSLCVLQIPTSAISCVSKLRNVFNSNS